MVKPGDLVFHDGWFGIVTDNDRSVLFGNGLETRLEKDEFELLEQVDKNTFVELISARDELYDINNYD